MEDTEQDSTYLNSCKVQLLKHNIKPSDNGNVDKLRLSFLEEELRLCNSKLSTYEKSTSFILAQLYLINNWIESCFESQQLIDTSSATYQNSMKNYDMNKITSIAKQIKYVTSKPRSNSATAINQEDDRGANLQTSREDLDSSVECKTGNEAGLDHTIRINAVRTVLESSSTQLYEHTNDVKHKCKYCMKSFTRQQTLVIHERRHRGEKLHSCPTCHKKFVTSDERTKHQQIHLEEKSFKCKFCDETFGQKFNLRNHISIHTGERPFACSSCDKTFVRHSDLKSHQVTHDLVQPYKCNFCERKYSSKASKMRHEITHSDQHIYNCTFCTKTFKDKCSWKSHIQTHTKEKPFQCEICGKSFARKTNFNDHANTHTQTKPYNCEVCGKCFMFRSTFQNHKEGHSGKEFTCKYCNKALKTNYCLKAHLKICKTSRKQNTSSK